MTEREKMLSGEMYDASDEELKIMRHNARILCYKYNIEIHPNDKEEKIKVLKELLPNVGEGAYIEPSFTCDYGVHIEAGKNLYMNFGCTILDCAKVKFGDNVMLAPNVGIYTAGHPIDPVERHIELIEFAHEINIGSNVWIGANSVILPGVTIGDNTVIGAGSVVTKDIPSNVVAAGNPCRVIKKIKEKKEEKGTLV